MTIKVPSIEQAEGSNMNDRNCLDNPNAPDGVSCAASVGKLRVAVKSRFPAVDVSDTGEAYLYTFDLPGLTRDRVEVRVYGNVLCLAGVRTTAEDGATRLQAERPSGAFVRHLALPDDSQIEESRATISEGVLRLRIPKRTPAPAAQPLAASLEGRRSRMDEGCKCSQVSLIQSNPDIQPVDHPWRGNQGRSQE